MEHTNLTCILLRRSFSFSPNLMESPSPPVQWLYGITVNCYISFQAEILATYKPAINTTLLIPNLRQVEEMVTKALEYFNSTRHMVLYYEDIIKNRTVRHIFISHFQWDNRRLVSFRFSHALTLNLLIWFLT